MKTFKKIFFFPSLFLYFLFFATITWSGKGIVIVLEAPLLEKPDLKSRIVDWVRKGQKIYIHNKHFLQGPLELVLGSKKDLKKIGWTKEKDHPQFYLTLGRFSGEAYIPKKYVKLIFKDHREFAQKITSLDPDPTDYRPREPLMKGYPLLPRNLWRGQLSVIFGPHTKSNYIYPRAILQEQYALRKGMYLSYGRKASSKIQERFYFGGTFLFSIATAEFTLYLLDNTPIQSREKNWQIGLGPYLAYDLWRNQNYQITLQGRVQVNWNSISVSQVSPSSGNSEERIFQGLSFTPHMASLIQKKEIIPKFDLLLGIDIPFFFPQLLGSESSPQSPSFWQPEGSHNDAFFIPLGSTMTFFLGLQRHY